MADMEKRLGVVPSLTKNNAMPEEPSWMYEEEQGSSPEWFNLDDWGIGRYFGDAPPIKWLVKDILPANSPGLVCGLGNVGKSFLMLDLAIAVAAGPGISPRFALGGKVPERGAAVFITAEDSADAVHRRINSLISSEAEKLKCNKHLYVVPLSEVGSRPLMITVGNEFQMTDAWYELCDKLDAIKNMKLLVLDPLQRLTSADVNSDPAAAQALWNAISEFCAQRKITVLLTHHMRKDGSREIDGAMAARESIRGTTALVDGARWVFALWLPNAKDRDSIEQVLDEPLDELSVVQGAVVKSNDIGLSRILTFVRDKQSGLLIDRTHHLAEELSEKSHLTDEQIMQTFGVVSQRWHDGDPFSHHAAAKSRYLGSWMCSHFDLTKQAARTFISEWLASGRLVKEPHPKIQRAQGLRFQA